MVEPKLAGFGIAGFRDIRDRMFVEPLQGVTILGGVNNSGKSAILDTLRLHLPLDRRGTLSPRQQERAVLDKPQPGSAAMADFVVGFCVDFGELDAARGIIRALTASDPTGRTFANLEAVLNAPVFKRNKSEPDPNKIWIWTDESGGIEKNFIDTIEGLQLQENARREATSSGFSGENSWNGVLTQVLKKTRSPTRIVHVPPSRQITPTEHRNMQLPGTAGAGLPGMLLGLIAPQAEEFYTAKARLESITNLLREVLEEPTTELLVPHDGATVHVAFNGRVLPLTHLGAGIEQIVLLATICTEYSDSLILMEEPDLFLHPTLQRRLLAYLSSDYSNTYVLTTHSAAMLDTELASVYRVSWDLANGTTSALVSSPGSRAALATALGFRASDLVQANVVIWIEGPSDRIYLKKWLSLQDSRLIEGIHYSFIMYGGRLAEHLTIGSTEGPGKIDEDILDRFLEITRINRHAIFIMDSDLTSSEQPLSGYKTRLTEEFKNNGNGFTWITCGTMIENYLEPDDYIAAYKAVHSRKNPDYNGDLETNPFKGGVLQPNKVAIAREAVARMESIPQRGRLAKCLERACKYIRSVNDVTGT